MPFSIRSFHSSSRGKSSNRSLMSDSGLSPTPSGSRPDLRFGSQLSVPETLPPGYEEADAPTMADDKAPSSCPKCGCSCRSKTLDHSSQTLDINVSPPIEHLNRRAPTLDMVVWAPTEAPTRAPASGSVYMEKVHELIPKLEIARQKYEVDNREWERASRQRPSGSRAETTAWAQRTISKTELETQSIVLEASLSWVAEDGVGLRDVQSLMSIVGVDLATQTEVNNMWQQMEGKKGTAINV